MGDYWLFVDATLHTMHDQLATCKSLCSKQMLKQFIVEGPGEYSYEHGIHSQYLLAYQAHNQTIQTVCFSTLSTSTRIE